MRLITNVFTTFNKANKDVSAYGVAECIVL